MTSSNILKYVVSNDGTTDEVAPRKPSIKNLSLLRNILEQQGKDVFEYSVFGSPQQKIGDFTQKSLARWSA